MISSPVNSPTRSHAATGLAAAEDLAGYLLSLSPDAWSDPTGCSEWDIRWVAIHVGVAGNMFGGVILPVLEEEPQPQAMPLRQKAKEKLEGLPLDEIAKASAAAARKLAGAVDKASAGRLEQQVDFPFGSHPSGTRIVSQ